MPPPPFTYFGGKTRIASQIVAVLPKHSHYVEPFAGSLSVLLSKPVAPKETVSDVNGHLMTFWRVLRERPRELAQACALTPHSRAEYLAARDGYQNAVVDGLDDVEIARRIWVQLTQSRTGTLRKTGWRHYVDPSGDRFGIPGYLTAYVERMMPAAERIHDVSLECRPALELVVDYGKHEDVLIYADPPYMGPERRGGRNYEDEMGEAEHVELLDALTGCASAVVLSGYRSPLYDNRLRDWDRITITASSGHSKVGDQERTEVVWSNRPISPATLFDHQEDTDHGA
ncbi:DNA adenine methylase [Rhodococcoides fascians]|jgi:DNA adenine methylase|uniref:DNA adenine methylase n=1 Tax=Rhodococcoides fascians TaxID=1828 RepID=UPI00379FAF7E